MRRLPNFSSYMVDDAMPKGVAHEWEDVEAVLRGLVRQPCLTARHSYGDELRLHFGQPLADRMTRLEHRQRGEWVLGTRGSLWRLSRSGVLVSDADRPADVFTEQVAVLAGVRVATVRLSRSTLDLELHFENGLTFVVPLNDDQDDLAAWELFTPDGQVLTIGPGRRWDLSRADAPNGT